MSRPFARLLVFWFFVALQAMTPFIHAHAGAVQLNHAGFMHLHQGAHDDAAWHGAATDAHGSEVGVAQGMPLRHAILGTIAEVPHLPASRALLQARTLPGPGAGLPAPPTLRRALPDHTRPLALAPPFA